MKKEIIEKKREIEKQIHQSNRELRKLQQNKLEEVRSLEERIELVNLFAAPLFILLFAIALWLYRYIRAEKYRRTR